MAPGMSIPRDDANADPSIRVVLADDRHLVREAPDHVLAAAEGVEVVATCHDRDSLLRAIEAQQLDGGSDGRAYLLKAALIYLSESDAG